MNIKLISSLVVVFVFATVGVAWLILSGDKSDTVLPVDQNNTEIPDVKLPEDEDQVDEQPASQTPDNTNKAEVLPFISAWEHTNQGVKARGYVAHIYEDGGDCRFLIKNMAGQTVASNSSKSVSAGTNTSCPEVAIDISGLSPGSYQIFLEYESATKYGLSQALEGPNI